MHKGIPNSRHTRSRGSTTPQESRLRKVGLPEMRGTPNSSSIRCLSSTQPGALQPWCPLASGIGQRILRGRFILHYTRGDAAEPIVRIVPQKLEKAWIHRVKPATTYFSSSYYDDYDYKYNYHCDYHDPYSQYYLHYPSLSTFLWRKFPCFETDTGLLASIVGHSRNQLPTTP